MWRVEYPTRHTAFWTMEEVLSAESIPVLSARSALLSRAQVWEVERA